MNPIKFLRIVIRHLALMVYKF